MKLSLRARITCVPKAKHHKQSVSHHPESERPFTVILISG